MNKKTVIKRVEVARYLKIRMLFLRYLRRENGIPLEWLRCCLRFFAWRVERNPKCRYNLAAVDGRLRETSRWRSVGWIPAAGYSGAKTLEMRLARHRHQDTLLALGTFDISRRVFSISSLAASSSSASVREKRPDHRRKLRSIFAKERNSLSAKIIPVWPVPFFGTYKHRVEWLYSRDSHGVRTRCSPISRKFFFFFRIYSQSQSS